MRLFTGREGRGLFYRPARWLQSVEEKYRKASGIGNRGQEVLIGIYGSAGGKAAYREYGIAEKERLIAFFMIGMGLAAFLGCRGLIAAKDGEVQELSRPQNGAGSAVYELKASLGEERLGGIRIEVPERKLSKAQAHQLLTDAATELEERIEQEGWRLEALEESLSLPDTLQDGRVDVRWESSRYDLLDGSGNVRNELLLEEGETLTLQAVLSCQDMEKTLVYPVHVIPKGTDAISRLSRQIAWQMQEEESREETENVLLPGEFDGKALTWRRGKPSYGLWIFLLTLAGCLVLKAASERDLGRQGEKRRQELLREYPSFLLRLTLLAGTGMPLRKVFRRMAGEGEGKAPLPVYEEVLRTVREMEGGLTELQAYENFGNRCQLPQYKKCASLLSQNLRKGTGGLLSSLEQEAGNAFEERKAMARRKGEEAQTRLLLPMLLMLIVVMIFVMVPACFSFGGL